MKNLYKGSFAIVAATVFWAIGGGVFNKLLFASGFPLAWSPFFGFLIGGLLLLGYSKAKGVVKKKSVFSNKWFYALALSNALVGLFSFLSYESIDLGTSAFLQMLSVPLAPFAAWLFLKEKASARTVAALLLALFGLFAINNFSLSFSAAGIPLAVASAFATVATLLLSRFLKEEFNSLLAAYVFLAGAAMLLPIAVLSAPFPEIGGYALLLLAALGLFDIALGDALRIYSLSKAPVRIISLLELFQTLTFSLAGWVFFSEAMTSNTLFGGALVIAAAVFALQGKEVI